MTKKHFQQIADAIKLNYSQASTTKELKLIENIVEDLCSTFKNLNNLFDSNRFKAACGIEK
jgi:hypothetical protein